MSLSRDKYPIKTEPNFNNFCQFEKRKERKEKEELHFKPIWQHELGGLKLA